MSPGEQMALEPALAPMLAQDLEHPAARRVKLMSRQRARCLLPVARLEHGLQLLGDGLIGAEQVEVAGVHADDIAQEDPEQAGI